MNIYFSGAGGTGKTSVLNEIESRSPKYQIATVPTRDIMPEGITSHADVVKMASENPGQGIRFQTDLMNLRYDKLLDLQESENINISDRSVLDAWVYYLIQNSIYDQEVNSTLYYKMVHDFIMMADKHVIFKIEDLPVNICDDSVRATNRFNAMMIEDVILATIKRIQLANTHLQTWITEEDGVTMSHLLGGKVVILSDFDMSIEDRATFLINNVINKL